MADPLFQVGDKVVARRERRLHMTVTEVGVADVMRGTGFEAVPGYRCTVDDEHSAAHGKGRATRWFVEQDLELATGPVIKNVPPIDGPLPENTTVQEMTKEEFAKRYPTREETDAS